MKDHKAKKQSSTDSPKDSYQCHLCEFSCNHSEEFGDHMSKTHSKQVFCCVTGFCTLWFFSQNGLRQHCKKNHSDVLKCDACNLVCMSPSLLNAHRDSAHLSKKGTCPSCNKTFSRADDAKRHHLKNCPKNPNREIRCKQCLKEGNKVDVVGAELGLLNHLIQIHYFQGSHLCAYCHRVFDSDVKIESHHKMCTKNRPEK